MESEMTERIRVFEEDSNFTNPDVEMGDAVIDRYIMEGLESSRWNISEPKDGQVPEAPAITDTRKIAVPAINRTANANYKKADKATPTTATQNTIPRANGNNQTSCSNINFVQFIDSMKVYLQAAIAQFMMSGPGTALPNLPPRPNCQNHGGKIVEQTIEKQPELLQKATQVKPTWATVSRTSLHTPAAPVKDVRVHNKPPTLTGPPAKAKKTGPKDDCLFLRLGKKHAWRALSPAGVRDATAKLLELPPQNIEHVYRVPTGFALRAKNLEVRQLLLDSAESFVQVDAILEKASDLVALRIATIPVAIHTLPGKVVVTNKMVTDEIARVTSKVPVRVRPHEKGRVGAPYQTWVAHFERASVPRPGFRLFDDSGIAVRHKPRQTVS
ncbi:EKA-like protein [Blumeria hordei DH14]|uniref:EKA-like protein n=1 Tax=Blumeria graminis f. sp. hordei (strain DH14) TaxID=546991 RepID=N1JC54_BLUG1|nr:EKA-like protein [Blumeria hordei DH14]